MLFLGNAASFHLASWISIYQKLGYLKPDLATIHEVEFLDDRFGLKIRVKKAAKIIAYCMLGIKLRFTKFDWVHAHGASGYGLAALLSGKRYIATVYGSEIFAPHSLVYKLMIRMIMWRAKIVTVTSNATRAALIRNFNVSPDKIRCFHTGVNTEYVSGFRLKNNSAKATEPQVVLSMRNTDTQYRTIDIINACIALTRAGLRIRLIVLLGNGSQEYFNSVKNNNDLPWITYLPHRIENQEMLKLMAKSDVCVSYPITDQLSSTVLEALCLDRSVVIGALDAYSPLINLVDNTRGLHVAVDGNLELTIKNALNMSYQSGANSIIKDKYGIDQAVGHLAEILEYIND